MTHHMSNMDVIKELADEEESKRSSALIKQVEESDDEEYDDEDYDEEDEEEEAEDVQSGLVAAHGSQTPVDSASMYMNKSFG